ncbi:MAG: T9SS type A sorting domain-containing protein [Ignavibacteria bacterium]|nr:T9SS type A sorting domain-containing protein [Ignavibacteria bacterium]
MNSSPTSIELSQNYPNPFNPSTSISFYLAQSGFVTLRVFNSMGEEVRTLINEKKDAGANVVTFTADGLPSGTYVYQLNVDGKIAQKKMVLMK